MKIQPRVWGWREARRTQRKNCMSRSGRGSCVCDIKVLPLDEQKHMVNPLTLKFTSCNYTFKTQRCPAQWVWRGGPGWPCQRQRTGLTVKELLLQTTFKPRLIQVLQVAVREESRDLVEDSSLKSFRQEGQELVRGFGPGQVLGPDVGLSCTERTSCRKYEEKSDMWIKRFTLKWNEKSFFLLLLSFYRTVFPFMSFL